MHLRRSCTSNFDRHHQTRLYSPMTRSRNPDNMEKEARLQQALTAFKRKELTASDAIAKADISRRTFFYRLTGKLPRNQAHEKEQLLSHIQEDELVRWITQLTATGYPPRHATLFEIAEIIQKKRDPVTLETTTNSIKFGAIGKQWIGRFMARHPELSSVRPRSMDMARVKDTSFERLSKWFEDLKNVTEKYNILPENMYNMDESGFAIGEVEASKCIINTEIRGKFQKAKPGRQEWVTSIECICADGTAIPPLIIFKAESLLRAWIPASTPKSWAFSYNTRGWTSNQRGLEWLQQCFELAT